MKPTGYTIFLALLLAACHSRENPDRKTLKSESIDSLPERLTNNAVQAPPKQDTIHYDDLVFPLDSSYKVQGDSRVKILPTGTFHSDEVWDGADRLEWYDLFKNKMGFYLSKTKIKTIHVQDFIDDDSNAKTGWEVAALHKDSCLLLINAPQFLSEHPVHPATLYKDQIFPGDTVLFNYFGINYKLFAAGGRHEIKEHPEWPTVWNYKLYMQSTKKGSLINELLVASPSFDDEMVNILFAGDIDGDDIPDLIIDVSNDYNASVPALYLSRPANEGHILKVVAGHTSVGC